MTLDVGGLLASGWRPTPFRQFVLKIHSRCNLACDYCYMYELADQSWRLQPRRMSPEVIGHVATRIAEHARTHDLPEITLILHGGEPLLAGPDLIRLAVTAVREAAGREVRAHVKLQTNGVLLDDAYLRLFDELGVRVGVSLDGDVRAHDLHRRRKGGQGSHEAVHEGLDRLRATDFRHLFSGLLCTVDLRNDPVGTYEALLAYEPEAIDFLLPHGNWDTPPPGRTPGEESTPYGDWLVAAFDRWYGAPRQETRVRLFGDILHLLFGGISASEGIGLAPVAVAVIETDGGIEQSDTLKSAYDGATKTGLHVARDSFDSALLQPGMAARQLGVDALSAQCRSCPLHRVCGGGLYPHRYRAGDGFANPSVYCPDLLRLITHIRRTVARDVASLRERRR
jgi:uncharacterized protein